MINSLEFAIEKDKNDSLAAFREKFHFPTFHNKK